MPGLDGLRALAVLAVIAYHLDLAWAPGGLLGVCVFFVLSGYLITSILLRQWESTGSINFKDFWLRRARRLLPALFVMLGGVLAWAAFWAPDRLPSLGWEALAALFYSSNWRQIFHQVSYFESFGPLSPLGHLWSLAVEGQFYLFWPLLLGLGLRYLPRRSLLVGGTVAIALISALVMALLYVPGLDPSRIYYGTDTRAFALLIGAVLALVWPSNRLSAALSGTKRLTLDLAGGAGLLIILIMMVKTNEYQTFLYQGGLLLFSIAAAVVVAVLAHPASRLGKVFALQPLRWLGACSYGIYLWHYPVIVLTNPVVNTGGTDILRSLAQIAISVALAALSFYFIEEPIRRGRWKISGQKQLEPGWRWKSLVVTGKIALVSISMVLSVFCLTVYGSMQLYQDTGSLPAQEQVGEVGAIGQIPQSGQDKMQDRSSPEVISENNPEAKPDISSGAKPEMSPEAKPEMPTQTKPEIPQENPEGPPATNPEPNQEDSVAEKKEYTGQGLTLIGDSVMLNLKPILEERLPGIVIDAKVGRQMYEAIDVITELQAQGKVGKIVIIGLGTNGSFTAEQLTKTLDSLQGVEQIVLLNSRVPRPWQDVVNQTLAEVAKTYPRTKLVDWFTASKGHNEYFYKDGVHLNPTGAEAYAELLIREISLWVQL
ncbi:MAG TPA: acyltransferase family protein [Peptococcaceae bacterium]|nr:acyltransferase family protein [Peptococcaceae bacterium]